MASGGLGPDQSLAIVIPAYKDQFLADTLESIAGQSDKRFTVYVGDDASPGDIESIVDRYRDRLAIRYTRFATNLGGAHLVDHWHRCVSLADETWVWLFSDDDLMSEDCVAAFRAHLSSQPAPADLFRFRVQEIDGSGRVVRPPQSLKSPLWPIEFCTLRFRGQIRSYVPEHVFRRTAFIERGGFPHFALAWCSDDAAWVKLAERAGMHEVPAGIVSWRRSGLNITSRHAALAPVKLLAATEYVRWLQQELPLDDRPAVRREFRALCRKWLLGHSRYLQTSFTRAGIVRCARNGAPLFPYGTPAAAAALLRSDLARWLRGRRKRYPVSGPRERGLQG